MMKTIFLIVLLIPLIKSFIEWPLLEGSGDYEESAKAETREFAKTIINHDNYEVEAVSGTKIHAKGKGVDVKATSNAIADLNHKVGPIAETDSKTDIKTHCC